MSHDPELYYNPKAQPLPVIHDEENILLPYMGTKTDDDGTVIWYPDSDEQERYKLEFYTCMRKALDESPDDMEKCLVLLADYALWPKYFHRWFLAMVAQAMNINRDYGNSMVPMLIGGEGIKKSIFCKNILPPSMREYYMDDIKMQNPEQVERVLGRMWLVCIDEFNAKTDREQAKVKRLLTEKDVQMRKMRSAEYTMTPRLCSFIATTNDPTPLSSAEGNRRYLCIEVKGEIDMSERVPYKQMFAQAVTELQDPDCLYWFTSEDEQEIREHNHSFMEESTAEGILPSLFEPTAERTRVNLWRTIDIQEELAKHLNAKDIPNLKTLSKSIKALRWPKGANNGVRGYYLKLLKSATE